jgi:protein-L-isoaspartate(D-aspartate) O-methyltransferase
MFKRDPEKTFTAQRHQMVEWQIERRGVHDPAVLAAMAKVPRHEFVSENLRDEAYADYPLPIGSGQTISQPYIVASMTQELRLDEHSIVLEIGTGCGYQTAVLAEIARHVYSIEVIPELLRDAETRLKRLGYDNVTTRCADGSNGWPEHAPFDGILVAAAAYKVPLALEEQLAENGNMIIPLVAGGGFYQELVRVNKTQGELKQKTLYGVRFVPLTGGGS